MRDLAQYGVSGLASGSVYALIALGIVLIYKTSDSLNFAQAEMGMVSAFVAFSVVNGIPLTFLGIGLVVPQGNLAIGVVVALLFSVLFGLAAERFLIRPLREQSGINAVVGVVGLFAIFYAIAGAVTHVFSIQTAIAAALVAIPTGWLVGKRRLGASRHSIAARLMTVTLGLDLIVIGVAGLVWGYDTKSFPEILSGPPVTLASVAIGLQNVTIAFTSLLLMLTLFLFFRFTKTGLAMRATASNRVAAGLMGINVGSVSMISWGLGSFLAAVGGILTAPVQLLDPYFMTLIGIKAFAAAVLGGLTSLPGAVAGGLLLGIAENLVGGYLANELKVVFPFVLIVATLTLRPDGLFGAIHRWKLQQ